ncbi:family S53 protease [Amylostereum chailletii]|nr:family S53 protease [Amylostereum chailletii]
MISSRAFLLFPALCAGATAAVSVNPRDLILHESREDVPAGFTVVGPAPGSTALKFRLGLAQNNVQGLQDALMDVSTPNSANYGKHLSKAEVNALVAPGNDTVQAIQSWLSASGVNASSLSPAGDWLGVETTVDRANALFGANFSVFSYNSTDGATPGQVIRTLSYSIPAGLKGHLDLVYPAITFPNPERPNQPMLLTTFETSQSSSTLASCDSIMTPACLQKLYKIHSNTTIETSNQIAVTGFNNQFANTADLQVFLRNYTTVDPSTSFSLQTVSGGQNSQNASMAGLEANLDIQYTVGLAPGVPTQFISVGLDVQDPSGFSGSLDLIDFLLNEDTVPQVWTTSYVTDEGGISPLLAEKMCNAYAQLGARGTSVIFASGDGGVSGGQKETCNTFLPTFPSSCPYVTSVGATEGFSLETGATLSAGGFSDYFPRPAYQSAAVSAYLSAIGGIDQGRFNASGRAFPDVAAAGVKVRIVMNGSEALVDGASCAAPIFASVVALLNDRLIAAGRSPLGFLNPFLYSKGAQAFKDITSGGNPGCATDGFSATTGWDPVTGLGSPNFEALLKAVGL